LAEALIFEYFECLFNVFHFFAKYGGVLDHQGPEQLCIVAQLFDEKFLEGDDPSVTVWVIFEQAGLVLENEVDFNRAEP
jgi:hypothetical protein